MKTLTMLTMSGALLVAAPAFAGDTAASPTPSASEQCKSLRTSMKSTDPKAFADRFGTNASKSNAFGKCRSERATRTADAARTARTNAAEECRAEETAAEASTTPDSFRKQYGSGNGANAFGKCVSMKASAKTTAEVRAQLADEKNAAKTCKAQSLKGREFGRCVSSTAKAAAEKRKQEQAGTQS